VDLARAETWLREQSEYPAMLAIGEAGLDKLCDTPWTEQTAAFDLCIELAIQLKKPLIIHCVRAYEEVLQQLRRHSFLPAGKAVFHGFNKHPHTAAMLLKTGCYLSFGAALLRSNSHAAEALQQTPADRFFLETDDKDVFIQEIYARAAAIRDINEGILASEIRQNAITIFTKEKLPNLP
jgi:TatD DNase family protein